MTHPQGAGSACELEVLVGDPSVMGRKHASRSVVAGLRECTMFAFVLHGATGAQVVIDDVACHPQAGGRYEWTPTFIAGQVDVLVSMPGGADCVFHLDVGADMSKVAAEHYDEMVEDIRRYRAALLLDSTAASKQFGAGASAGKFNALVRLARLLQHGPVFLRHMEHISRQPHQVLRPITRAIPLDRARRLAPAALRDPRIVQFANDPDAHADSLDALWLTTSCVAPTADSPSNRAMKALMLRMAAQISSLASTVRLGGLGGLGGDREERERRRPHREQRLRQLQARIERVLRLEPWCSVSRPETSAASLVQISAQPEYSRAYRNGMQALRLGVDGSDMRDRLPVRPTWGIYEAWCFVTLLAALSKSAGNIPQHLGGQGVVRADESFELTLHGAKLEIHFQAGFPFSRTGSAGQRGWSLSRRRYPDIIVVLRRGSESEFIVLDAKYRRKRSNVIEAMESAHIYHDSLRVGKSKPVFCALLLPAEPGVQMLDTPAFLAEHGVGTISRCCPGGGGMARTIALIEAWAKEFAARAQPTAMLPSTVQTR